SAGGWYSGSGLDSGRIGLYGVAAAGKSLNDIETAIDAIVADVMVNGVTEAELQRAKSAYLADYIYGNDNQSSLARRYGWTLATGGTVEDVEAWPDRIRAVTLEQVNTLAKTVFNIRASVTSRLTPANDATPSPATEDKS
ncbi:MAG: insulinase family protein, partial [Pseudomonadota bacterium]